MKNFLKKISVTILLSMLIFSLSACGRDKVEEITFYEGPIEGWEDLALPESAEWTKTNISGLIENHWYDVDMGKNEFLAWMENSMEVNGWVLDYAFYEGRRFMKDGDTVSIVVNNSEEDTEISVFIIIEPDGAYGSEDDKEDEEEATTD